MTVGEKGKLTELDLDRRVRERLLASGRLGAETIEGHLAGLQDLEEQAESISIDQPALGPSTHTSRVEPDLDDEGSE
ncbi:hypothetical protein SOCE26_085760 [Sorangium cellulosum]|uniref:Uncharacterized protein n=1 Tax=Sorangium cellulosum TaxID=56 RepID=A0A2L0F649_SORCE|nr:hypothetical protein [Sorangium cellulosum]AUX47064.1 hypothetical protein SOCE26_085760 [Sorangium cellulosum]